MGYWKREIKGEAEIKPGEAIVGEIGTWIVKYKVGEGGIKIGGGIRIAFEHGADWGRPQTENPKDLNFVSAHTSGEGDLEVKGKYYSWSPMVEVIVKEKPLKKGDFIEVILGDKSKGSLGFKCQTISQESAPVNIMEDTEGDGNYQKFPHPPTIKVLSEKPERLVAILKSFSSPGEENLLLIRAEDKYGNVAEEFKEEVVVKEKEEVIKRIRFSSQDKGVRKVKIKMRGEGIKRYQIEGKSFTTLSNPVVVSDAKMKVYWGQIHGHTILSDGLGSVDDYFKYARDTSNLDFAAVTDHGIWTDADLQEGDRWVDIDLLRHYIGKKEWDITRRAVKKFYQPGKFVTLLGYEWCSQKYGDKNVYFLDEDEMIEHPNTPKELYYALEGRKAIIISHMMTGVLGRRCVDWSFFHPELERCVEICSFHGVKEYAGNDYFECDFLAKKFAKEQKGNMVQDALARGYRLGIVGGSDDHSGKPGSSVKGILPCPLNGLTAVWAEELTRPAIWEALYNRRCYATTGARIILYFTLNGFPMGSEIRGDEERILKVKVQGTRKIKSIEVIKNNKVIYVYYGKDFDEEIEYRDRRERAIDYYYIRVRQEDGEMAWSSPIWVEFSKGR